MLDSKAVTHLPIDTQSRGNLHRLSSNGRASARKAALFQVSPWGGLFSNLVR